MDRKTIVLYTKLYPHVFDEVIEQYCLEKGKDSRLTHKFVLMLHLNKLRQQYCYDIALSYFQLKYNVTLLHDKEGKTQII